jgi:3-oxoacyl-[acyl-carrier protein] reductase
VISGASRGLGAAIAAELLERGHTVSGFARQSTAELEQLERRHKDRFVTGILDVTSTDSLDDFLAEARSRLGPIFGVVNNAATVQEGILATLPELEIERMIAVNLTAALRLTRLCMRDMLQRASGRVINISSIVGLRGYNGLAVYSATKAALDGFTRSLAREVGRRGITANSIAPGYMKSQMSAGLSELQHEQIIRRTPLGRLAEFADVVPLVCFLMSEEASFITSQTICVDGGITN